MLRSLLCAVVVIAAPAVALAHDECSTDAECDDGLLCFEEACSIPCEIDDECPAGEVCADATACVHVEAGGDCAASPPPRSSAWWLALVGGLAAIVAVRRR